MKNNNINFLLFGGCSFLNKGCEAIVNSTVKKIRKITAGNIVVSTDELNYGNRYYNLINKYVKSYYKDNELSESEIEKIKYYKTIPFDYENFERIYEKDVLKEIEFADICLSVGGDCYCYGETNWLFMINKEIRKRGKKNILWCASLDEKINSDEMIRDIKSYDLIIARESLTYKKLSRYINKERLMLEPDTAFSLDKKKIELPDIFKKNKNVVGINLSPLVFQYTKNKELVLKSIYELIKYILNETEDYVCLIPHVYINNGNNDLEALKEIKELFKNESRVYLLNERNYDCEELKYVISKCSQLIAARTHASIAAYSMSVPTLVIGYSLKSKGIATDLFGEYSNYVISVENITPELLLEKYNFIVDNRNEIVKTLNEKMASYVSKAQTQLKRAMQKLEELDRKYVSNITQCTGCMSCYNICPHNAIEPIEDNLGFKIPVINKSKCTQCNLCKKSCPINCYYKNEFHEPEFYVVKNKNEKERMESSSGGIFIKVANEIIKQKGVVYGAQIQDALVKHIRVDNARELHKLTGSKYAQSEINTIFRKVKDDLEKNRLVLFSGTPCQIEGLKKYLGKKEDGLLCVSVVCHGVPSSKLLKKYVKEKGTNIVNFRNKENGWHEYSIEYADGTIKPFFKDEYMVGYLDNLFLRESCYNCQMKYFEKNTADLVIGDFWGIKETFQEIDDNKGISLLIVNSQKGKRFFETIRKEIDYKETTFDKIVEHNNCIVKPVKYTTKREKLIELLNKNELITVIGYLHGINQGEKVIYLENQLKDMKKYIKDLEEAKEYFLQQIDNQEKNNQELEGKLERICQSRRWRLVNKIANIIKKKGKSNE